MFIVDLYIEMPCVTDTIFISRKHSVCTHNERCSMSVMSEMGRLNFPQKGPACVWKLDFKPALACIRLSNIEFSSRGANGFFSPLTLVRIEECTACNRHPEFWYKRY